MIRIPRQLESIYAAIALWFFFGNPINVLNNGADGSQLIDTQTVSSSFLLPGISMAIYCISVLILLNCWETTLSRITKNPQLVLLGLFLLIVIASTQWSAYPVYTLRRSVLVLGSTAFAVFFSTRFSFTQQLKMLTFAFGVTIVLCFFISLFFPVYGTMTAPHAGAWRGVHMHKNELGAQMGFISIFLLVVRSTDLFRGLTKAVVSVLVVGSVFLVVASTSTTGLVILFTLGIASILCNMLRLNYQYAVPVVNISLIVMMLIFFYIQSNLETLLGVFDKGTDLTGRDQLWPAVLQMVSQKPLLGYGYEGFWRGSASPGAYIWKVAGWPTPNAHNGYLDLLLATGYIGGFLFFAGLMFNLFKSLARVGMTKNACAICPIIALLFLMMSNTTETTFFVSDSWILYVWISLIPAQPFELNPEHLTAHPSRQSSPYCGSGEFSSG